MNPKTYQAQSMAEALSDVKRDLGRDAVILHTRSFRKGGLLGLIGGTAMWEVTAAPNVNVPRRFEQGRYISDRLEAPTPKDKQEHDQPPADAMGREIGEIRRIVQALLERRPKTSKAPAPPAVQELQQLLLDQDVREPIAMELIGRLQEGFRGRSTDDSQVLRQHLTELIADRIRTAKPVRPGGGRTARLVAFIGPTGVGKTTTIAKLAANLKLREGKRVGLITIDTYRIAAVDQLQTYANIIDVPLNVVLTETELAEAVAALGEMDVVLIDTAGRSQNDRPRLELLGRFLAAAKPDEVHLVVSATGNRASTENVLDRFMPLGANRIVVTKLDEAASMGTVLNLADRAPLSYVTNGQNVPEDMAPAAPKYLAQRILEGVCYVA